MKLARIAIVILSGAFLLVQVSTAQTKNEGQPIARIGEQAIYDQDLLPSINGQLLQLKHQEYELKEKALENLVNQRLLEDEAKKKGLTVAALLEQVVYPGLTPPNEAEVQAYYLGLKSRPDHQDRSFREIKVQVEHALTQAKRQQARQEYLDRLREQANVVILLSPPRIEVTADAARLQGNPDAPVTIVEFADFQCPYCRNTESTLKEIMQKYKGKVRLGFRDFPLSEIHSHAEQAAEAARCAGDQGKFWEYHNLLYTNQTKLDQPGLMEEARTTGLDIQRFSACLASKRFQTQIESDVQSGTIAGVSGTPAFYINGIFLNGAQPLSEFEKIIDAELAGKAPMQARR